MKSLLVFILLFVSLGVSAQKINQFDTDGNRHGIWRKNFNKTKVLRYEGQFANGKEIGLFKFYKNIDGKAVLTATRQFNDSNNVANVKFYTSKSRVMSEGQMRGKTYIGIWKYYQKNSDQLLNLEHYGDNGLLQGERLVYYKNGQLAQREEYKDGKLEGQSIWYSENGTKIKEFNYELGGLHGMSKFYNGEGKLIVQGNYKRGKKHGIWQYFEDSKLVEEKDFTPKSKFKKK